MKTSVLLKSFLLFVSAVVLIGLLTGYENTGRLKIKGRVADAQGKNLKDVKVTLKEFGKELSSTTTNAQGKFTLEAEYQKKLTLHFEAKGFVSMYMQYDTELPLPKSDKNYVSQPFINMLSDTMTQFNLNTFSRKPITRFVYDPIEDLFVEDQSELTNFVQASNDPEGVIFSIKAVPDDSTEVDSGTVKIIQKGEVVSNFPLDSTGEVEFKMYYGQKARVEINAKNFHPSYFTVNTEVDNDSLREKEFMVSPVIPLVSKKTEYIDINAFNLPVKEFSYKEDSASFAMSPKVTETFREVLDSPKKLPIDIVGQVLDTAGKPVNNIDVFLKDGDSTLAGVRTKSDGMYALKTEFNQDVYLEMSSDKHHPAIVEVNTEKKSEKFQKVELKAPPVKVFEKKDAYVDADVFKNPVAYVEYRDSLEGFAVDTSVIETFENKIKEVKKKNATAVQLAEEVYPEDYGYFYIDGEVNDEINREGVDSALVESRIGNVVVAKKRTDKKGKFEMEFEYMKEYLITVKREGFSTIRFELNTDFPEEIADKDYSHKMDIPLFPKSFSQINHSGFEKPFTRLYYDTLEGKVVDDQKVLAAFQNVLNTSQKELLPDVLVVEGQIEDYSRRRHRDLKLIVEESGTPVDTLETSREGEFMTSLDYNKNYQLKFLGEGYYPGFIDLNTTTNGPIEIDSMNLGKVLTYEIGDENIPDSSVFELPLKSITYVPTEGFTTEAATEMAFTENVSQVKEQKVIASKRLAINGVVKDITDKRLKDIKVYLVEGKNKLDSVSTNRRGEFELKVPYQKNTVLSFTGQGYYQTYVDLNTQMPKDSITNLTAIMPLVTMVQKSEQYVDTNALAMPNQKMYYSIQDNTFVVDSNQADSFIAMLLEPKRIREKELEAERKAEEEARKLAQAQADSAQVAAEPVSLGELSAEVIEEDITELEVEISEQEDLSLIEDKNVIEEKEKEESLAKKSEEDEDFFKMLSGKDTTDFDIDIKNEILSAELLDDVEFEEVEFPEEEEINEELQKQQEELLEFNQILARSLVQRRSNVDPIPFDSTYTVQRNVRHFYSEQSRGVLFKTERNRIIYQGKEYELIHVIDWYFFDDYYLNGESISESTYYAELEKYNIKNERN